MSRSIHTTRQTYSKEKKYQFRDEEIKESQLNTIKQELKNKRLLKEGKQLSRKLAKLSFSITEPTDPTTVPIVIVDSGPYIHYPALRDDLYGVAMRLPVNVLAGIESITFCLGKEYQEKWEGMSDNPDHDPYTGRICYNEEGPFYGPPILGIYRPSNCKIFLFAYVYDKTELKLNVVESYLRLKMLSTFVHEVAHHDDEMRRSGRGRWLGLTDWRCENYAEIQQGEWVQTAVIPYLLERYPGEYGQLVKWITSNGGVEISLKTVAGEPRVTQQPGLFWLGYGIDSAVEEMLRDATNGKTPREVMLEFARDLHIGDHYQECLKALKTLLGEYPNDAEALGEKADTLIHLERYDEAEIVANECLQINPDNLNALEALCDIHIECKGWQALQEISSRGIKASQTDISAHRRFLEMNLIASLFLGDYQTAQEDIEALPDDKEPFRQRKLAFTALLAVYTGHLDMAMETAKQALAKERLWGSTKAIFKYVFNHAKTELEINEPSYMFTRHEQNTLKSLGLEA